MINYLSSTQQEPSLQIIYSYNKWNKRSITESMSDKDKISGFLKIIN